MTIQNLSPSAGGDFAAALNASNNGWNLAMGMHFIRATADEVILEIEIGADHRQPYGIVHGGVHAGLIEAATSTGAALAALARQQSVVGLENHTSFLHAVREGKLLVSARPLMRGRRTQVWEASVTDSESRTVASGRVRFLALESGASLAGETVKLK